MNYILLGRQLDTLSQEDGYLYTPDEILKEIIEYVGNINRKPEYMYSVNVNIKYDYYRRRRDNEWKLIKKDKIGWVSFDYCGCCDRFYKNPKGHLKTLKHEDYRKKGDKLVDIKDKITLKVHTIYGNGLSMKNLSIKEIIMRDYWRS